MTEIKNGSRIPSRAQLEDLLTAVGASPGEVEHWLERFDRVAAAQFATADRAASSSNPRRRVVIGVVLAAVVIGAVALGWMLTRPDPNRAIAGEVQCATSDAVVGIWITKDGGGSWAAARPGPRGLTYFNGTTNLDAYRVFVGCGGTPSQWAPGSEIGADLERLRGADL